MNRTESVLNVECYGREASGRIGTLRARVAWTGPWVIEGDEQEIRNQEDKLMEAFTGFTPIGRPVVTI